MNNTLKLDWEQYKKHIIETNGYDNLKFFILNEKNRMITKDYVKKTLALYNIDHNVGDITLFELATIHPSYIIKDWNDIKNFKMIFMGINVLLGEKLNPISNENVDFTIPLKSVSYERLEFLGDSVIRQVISDYLFIRYPNLQEGYLTKIRSQIENSSCLADLTRRIGLNRYVLLSRNNEIIKAREKNEKVQCDIFEAFIAALYLDSCGIKYNEIVNDNDNDNDSKYLAYDLITRNRGIGYSKCYNFITTLIEEVIDLTKLLEHDTNYKDGLLQYYHEVNWGDPTYGLMETIVDNNKMGKKYFKMYVRDNNKNIIGVGVGTSKQKGEKIAAKNALQSLKIIPNDNEDVVLPTNSPIIYHRVLC
jgi:ribonuclease-3